MLSTDLWLNSTSQVSVESVDIATWMKYKHLGKVKKGLIEEMAESGVENGKVTSNQENL